MSLRSARSTSFLAVALCSFALADQSGTVTLAPNTYLNLDTGAGSEAGGDILWDGLSLTPQAHAGLYNLGKYGARVFKAIHARKASSVSYSSAPISGNTLVAGDIFWSPHQ